MKKNNINRREDAESSESNRSDTSKKNNEQWSTRKAVAASGSGDSDSPRQPRSSPPNKILLVHGLNAVPVNCDRVFNLFCLYGNVTTVKMLKDDKALVEMEDAEAAKRCVSNLHLLRLDDVNRMRVKYSKHSFMREQVTFNRMSDGTPVQKVYSASKLNRFHSSEKCLDRRRVAAPSKILHFFNAPTDVCGSTIHKTVSNNLDRMDAISSITILPKRPGAKCSTGLIELKTVALATKTVLLSNHMTFESTKSKFPFLTKLCFSKWSEVRQMSATLQLSCAPSTPWLLHKSEHSVSTTEFPILSSNVMTADGGVDSAWTLLEVNDDERTTTPAANAPVVVVGGGGTRDDELPTAEPPTKWRRQCPTDALDANGVDNKQLLDMLRNRLCGGEKDDDDDDDDDDVFHSPIQSDDENDNSVSAAAIRLRGERALQGYAARSKHF